MDHRADSSRSWVESVKHRWPTALGIVVAGLTVLDFRMDVEFVSFIAGIVALMPLIYLGSAVLRLRWFAWVMLLAGLPIVFIAPADSVLSAPVILVVLSLAFVVAGVVRGELRKPGSFALQTVGMAVFGLVALMTLYVNVEFGIYLMAFAFLGHAVWDAFHFLRDRVVARPYAEFCGILDLTVSVSILYYLI